MAKKRKVKVKGKEMSVWDALEIVTDKNGYKYMKVKDDAAKAQWFHIDAQPRLAFDHEDIMQDAISEYNYVFHKACENTKVEIQRIIL